MSTTLDLRPLTEPQRLAATELKPWPQNPDYLISKAGEVYSNRRRHVPMFKMRVFVHKKTGYLRCHSRCNGRQVTFSVHRAVLETWVGRCPDGMEGAHLNGNRQDPSLKNLAWMTPAQNAAHRRIHGTAMLGEDNPKTALDDLQMFTAVMVKKCGIPTKQIAGWFGVSMSCVQDGANHTHRKELFQKDRILTLLRSHGVEVIQ